MRINTALRDASTNLFFNIPAPAVDVAGINDVSLSIVSGVSFDLDVDMDSEENGYLLIDASPTLSAGVSTAGSKFKRISSLEVNDFSALDPIDLQSAYTAVYGSGSSGILLEGSKIFVRVTVMMSNGQRGVPQIISALVQ